MVPLWTIGLEWNDVNNFMDLERAFHQKCNQIPMVVAQRFISSMMRRRVGACGVVRWSYQILSNDVTFEARPLCNLTRCTALWKSDIPKKIRYYDC